jgi:hypothetical protein
MALAPMTKAPVDRFEEVASRIDRIAKRLDALGLTRSAEDLRSVSAEIRDLMGLPHGSTAARSTKDQKP